MPLAWEVHLVERKFVIFAVTFKSVPSIKRVELHNTSRCKSVM